MQRVEHYRQNAAAAEEAARVTDDAQARAEWLKIATVWRQLADAHLALGERGPDVSDGGRQG